MDITAFWELIETTNVASNGNPYQQAALLVNRLAQCPEVDILEYQSILWGQMDRAYTADLWGAAHILGCGCGDDGFMDFRAWLIAQGKATFDKTLVDPEYLIEIVNVSQETRVEPLLYVAAEAYELKTGREMPVTPRKSAELQGQSREEHETLAHFPKLTQKFWKRCQDESV